MDSDTTRKNRMIFALLLIASFIVLTVALRDVDLWPFKVAKAAINAVVLPVQGAARAVTSPIADTFINLGNISTLRKDNLALREKVRRLDHENAALKKAEDENERLRGLLGEKKRLPMQTTPAKVISILGPWQSKVVIDKGSDDGIKKDMAVVAVGGIAGQVIEVNKTTAVIRLINDPKNGVAVEIKRTGERGILEGEVGGETRLRFIPRMSTVKKGDQIISSGLGGVYPRGLVVGKVSDTRKQPVMVEATVAVRPAVALERITDILVIRSIH